MTKALTEEEFMDAAVDAIGKLPEADYFYQLLCNELFDKDRQQCPVSSMPEADLRLVLEKMQHQSIKDEHYTAPEFLALFNELMAQGEEYDIAVRWTLAKLVGVALQKQR